MPESLLTRLDSFTRGAVAPYVVLFLTGVGLCILTGQFLGMPAPQVHDGFSYVLMADTFVSGRLANPTHELFRYFETFHILMEPTYASKYFPLTGIFLALGQLLWEPIFGMWIGVGLLGMGFFYGLKAIAPPTIAWLAALTGMLHFGVLQNWAYIFWGGIPFALAGTLVLGGMVRLWKQPARRDGVLCGLGLMAILLSRPFEGFFFCLPLGVVALLLLKRHGGATFFNTIAVGPVCGLVAGLGILGVYNQAITGSATTFPHTVFQQTYFPGHNRFIWEKNDVDETYVDDRIDVFQVFAPPRINRPSPPLKEKIEKRVRIGWKWLQFYVPLMSLAGLIALVVFPHQQVRWILWLLLGLLLSRILILFFADSMRHSHYTAVWSSFSVYLWGAGLTALHLSKRKQWILPCVGVVLVLQLGLLGMNWFTDLETPMKLYTSFPENSLGRMRRHIEKQIQEHSPAKDVIVVKYLPGHLVHSEWVYNSANIDHQEVIWARDRGDDTVPALRAYYPDRLIWRLETPVNGTGIRVFISESEKGSDQNGT